MKVLMPILMNEIGKIITLDSFSKVLSPKSKMPHPTCLRIQLF